MLLDAEGERWVESREILAVFQTTEDWRVTNGLVEGRILELEPSAQGKPALYGGHGRDVHPELLMRMRCLLEDQESTLPFCNHGVHVLLDIARSRFTEYVSGKILTSYGSGQIL